MKILHIVMIVIGGLAVYLIAKGTSPPNPTTLSNNPQGGNQLLNQAGPYANTLANLTSIWDKMTPRAQTSPDAMDVSDA